MVIETMFCEFSCILTSFSLGEEEMIVLLILKNTFITTLVKHDVEIEKPISEPK